MENLKIVTWNIGNSKLNLKANIYKINALFDLIQEENVDIIALQSVNLVLADDLELKFFRKSNTYHLIYDYSSLRKILKINKVKVETNPFITSYKEAFGYGNNINPNLKSDKKYIGRLIVYPFIDGISVLNTKLTDNDMDMNKVEIDNLIKKISDVRKLYSDSLVHKLLVCGSLGYNKDNDNIKYLIDEVSKLNLKLVDTKNSETTDYLFVPTCAKVEDVYINKNYSDISNHVPIIAKIRI